MWHLNNVPAPRDPSSGWLIVNDVQYPPDWPHDDLIALGLEWIEPESPALTAEAWPALAMAALRQSDLVAIRALKAGIVYPEEWQVYDDALRAIVNGAPGPLPEQPEYP